MITFGTRPTLCPVIGRHGSGIPGNTCFTCQKVKNLTWIRRPFISPSAIGLLVPGSWKLVTSLSNVTLVRPEAVLPATDLNGQRKVWCCRPMFFTGLRFATIKDIRLYSPWHCPLFLSSCFPVKILSSSIRLQVRGPQEWPP